MNHKPSPRKVLIALTLCVVAFALYTNLTSVHTKDDIQTGKLVYSMPCGWINMDHALPYGPSSLWHTIQKRGGGKGEYFRVRYVQTMKWPLLGRQLVAETAAVYELPVAMTVPEAKSAALLILMDVSEQFEQMQGSLPYNLLEGSRQSSFRQGDLTGNLLSLYVALHGCTLNQIKDSLVIQPVEESLVRWKREPAFKQKIWLPLKQDAVHSCFLAEWMQQTQKTAIHMVRIRRKNTWYF